MKKGFTLAEVLITLTIIGVIAALTIPNLMQKWEDAQTVSGVNEAYSILDNAMKSLINDKGLLSELDFPYPNSASAENANFLIKELSNYIKFNKICYSNTGCLPKVAYESWGYAYPYKDLAGKRLQYLHLNNGAGQAILANGMMIRTTNNNPPASDSEYIGSFLVDINGGHGPNRYGYDVFYFFFNKNGLTSSWWIGSQKDFCNVNINSIWQEQGLCGQSCSYWVRKHRNVDYKYRDVSKEW